MPDTTRLGCLLLVASLVSACAVGEGAGDDHEVLKDELTPTQRADYAAHELALIRAVVPAYVNDSSVYEAAKAGDTNAYYRAICAQALISVISRRAADAPISASDREVEWVREAIADFPSATDTREENPSWWISPAPGLVCLLAASSVKAELDADSRSRIAEHAADLADRITFDPAGRFDVGAFRQRQSSNRGNSQAEEVGFTASYLLAAYELLPDAAQREAWYELGKNLLDYSHSDVGSESPFEPGTSLVNNHQLRPHPIYTQSLLTSYAEIWAVHRQRKLAWLTSQGVAPTDRQALVAPEALPPEARTAAIGAAIEPWTTSRFGLQGAFSTIAADGEPVEQLDYADLRYTLANQPDGWQLLIPTENVGVMSQFRDPTTGVLSTYQLRDDKIWKYTCENGLCDAVFKHPLETQWNWIADQKGFGELPLPKDNVDAFAQTFQGGILKSYVAQGDRLWHYTCQGGSCSAQWARTLTQFVNDIGNHGAWAVPAPTSDLDTLSIIHDEASAITRGYLLKADRIWHYRCNPACNAVYTNTLTQQWLNIGNQGAYAGVELPPEGVRSLTQFYDSAGTLHSYVWKGDRVWKYVCQNGVCNAAFSKRLVDVFKLVHNQHVWADSVFGTYQGVCDWGFDAAIQNSAYAYGALRESLGSFHRDRYRSLQAAQAEEHGLTEHPYFPARNVNGSWSFGPLVATMPGEILMPLTDGWRFDHRGQLSSEKAMPTLDARINSHWFLNTLAGFNSAIAYLLLVDEVYLDTF